MKGNILMPSHIGEDIVMREVNQQADGQYDWLDYGLVKSTTLYSHHLDSEPLSEDV